MTTIRTKATGKEPKLPRTSDAQRARAAELLAALKARYPDAHCELNWSKPHELLFATILSAQCTDVAVNKATPALFARFPVVAAFASASPDAIEPYVRSLGFFRQKAKSIHTAAVALIERHGGEVPRTMEELTALRGVARKTANVVLGNVFGLNLGVVVDTHVQRLAARFGLTRHSDPVKIERDLMALFPQPSWCLLSHLLIFHGRRACKARNGLCTTDSICQRFCSQAHPKKGKP
ncbi:MAG: endonuclease III [Phycisphaerae bacterium]|jgi:endonuclease-3|nr:endonuclease III [Phycisphaerae bacterium]